MKSVDLSKGMKWGNYFCLNLVMLRDAIFTDHLRSKQQHVILSAIIMDTANLNRELKEEEAQYSIKVQ